MYILCIIFSPEMRNGNPPQLPHFTGRERGVVSHADVLRGSSRVSGAGTREEPLRTSAWEARGEDLCICLAFLPYRVNALYLVRFTQLSVLL